MKWVCFPKFYSPSANWPWLRISPQSSLYVIYCLILTAWEWLMSLPVFLCKLNPIKAHWGKGYWSFPFERSATFPPQADHVLVDLFSSMVDGGSMSKAPQKVLWQKIIDEFCTSLSSLRFPTNLSITKV